MELPSSASDACIGICFVHEFYEFWLPDEVIWVGLCNKHWVLRPRMASRVVKASKVLMSLWFGYIAAMYINGGASIAATWADSSHQGYRKIMAAQECAASISKDRN